MATQKPFTRLSHPDPATNQIFNDLYDKLSVLGSAPAPAPSTSAASPTPASTPTPAALFLIATEGSSPAPVPVSPSNNLPLAFIPSLASVPSPSPVLGAPYSVDGSVIQFSPASGDSGVLFRYTGGSVMAWAYMDGYLTRTQAQLSGLAGSLTAVHTGLLVWVSDYAHMLEWTGAAWQRGPGDSEHSDTFHMFAAAPTDAGWQVCDGTTGVKYLKYDGSTGTRNMPNTAGTAAYPKAGAAYAASETAAVAPTITPAGTVSTITPAGTISTPVFTGSPSTSTNVLNTGGSTAVVPAPYTPAGSISTPTLSGTPVTPTFTGTPASTSLSGGDPVANFGVILMYRQ